jgi:peptidoglycan/xylan/chitin deacetylase (PgdA/CDA1 family)
MPFPSVLRSLACALARPIFGGIGSMFCLHRVLPEEQRSQFPENRALEITPEMLRSVLEWVRDRGLEVIPLDALPERLRKPSGTKFACFVFDDGYRDNLEHALPVFREFAMPLAISLTTGFISGTEPVWWYALEQLLTRNEHITLDWQCEQRTWPCTNPSQKRAAFDDLAALIRTCTKAERVRLLDALLLRATVDSDRLCMNWKEVRTIAQDPLVTLCAHTVAHSTLNRLSEADALEELSDSKTEIESKLGRPTRHLAFPFGGRNAVGEREFHLAGKAGFQTAFTTRSANLFPAHAGYLDRLPRLTLNGNWNLISLIEQLESGLLPARNNGWRRVITN